MTCALSNRLLRSEQLLFALRVFFGTARLHRLSFRQELANILRLACTGSSGTNLSMKRIVLRSFPSTKTWRYNSRNVFMPFHAARAKRFAVSLVHGVVAAFGTTARDVVCRGF